MLTIIFSAHHLRGHNSTLIYKRKNNFALVPIRNLRYNKILFSSDIHFFTLNEYYINNFVSVIGPNTLFSHISNPQNGENIQYNFKLMLISTSSK